MAVPVDAIDSIEGTQIARQGMVAQVVIKSGKFTGFWVETSEFARIRADPEHAFPVLPDRRNGPEHRLKPVCRLRRTEVDEFFPFAVEFGDPPFNRTYPNGAFIILEQGEDQVLVKGERVMGIEFISHEVVAVIAAKT